MKLSSILVVDVETTGANVFVNDIISLAFVPFDQGLPALSVDIQVDPNAQWSEFARKNFQRFEHKWRREATSREQAAITIQRYLDELPGSEDFVLAGHNVGFDRSFIAKMAFTSSIREFRRISHRNLDTFSLLFKLAAAGEIPDSAVTSSGAFDYFGIAVPDDERHTANGDAVATRLLLERLLRPEHNKGDGG